MRTKWILLNMLALLLVGAACESNSDETVTQDQADASDLRSKAVQGQWRITYFFDSDKEETDHFSGYVFTFGSNGTVTAVNGAIEVSGTWSVTDSDSSDDDSPDDSDDVDFNLFFATPPDFEELSDDWDILEYSDSRIKLIDISGGDGDTDYLTFEKI